MLKQQARLITAIAISLDLVLIFTSFVAAFYLRRPYLVNTEFNDYLWFLMLVLPVWFGSLYASRVYESLRTRTTWSLLLGLFKAYIIAGCISAATIFILNPHTFSRMLFVLFLSISFVAMLSTKFLVRLLLTAIRRRGINIRNILLVGDGAKADEMSKLIELHSCWGIR